MSFRLLTSWTERREGGGAGGGGVVKEEVVEKSRKGKIEEEWKSVDGLKGEGVVVKGRGV